MNNTEKKDTYLADLSAEETELKDMAFAALLALLGAPGVVGVKSRGELIGFAWTIAEDFQRKGRHKAAAAKGKGEAQR